MDTPLPPPPNCFHRKRILGRFQCAPRGRTMRPLKLGILASFCYPGAGERRGPGDLRDLSRAPSGGGPGLLGVAELPGGSPAAKSQVGIRRWSRGARYLVPRVHSAPRLGAGKRGGDEDPITAAPAGSPGGGGGMGTQSLGQAGLGCSGPQLQPGLSCLIVYCGGAGRSPSRPLPRACPPARPLRSSLLLEERRASLWRRMSHE